MYEAYGKFPTYEEVAKKRLTTKQDVEQVIRELITEPRFTEKQANEMEIFTGIMNTLKNGYISLKIKIQDNEIADVKSRYTLR